MYIDGYKYIEIADEVKMNTGTVKTRFSYPGNN
jgi:DNA-directed RNA polymerase specialized sigma24 family protein